MVADVENALRETISIKHVLRGMQIGMHEEMVQVWRQQAGGIMLTGLEELLGFKIVKVFEVMYIDELARVSHVRC